MFVRRIAAIAVAGALIHFNVVRADAACGTHEHSSDAAPSQAHHASATHHEAHSHATHPKVHEQQACDTPTQPECCLALASCTLAFGWGAESAVGEYVPTREGAVTALTDIPVSLVSTPEPPPPKA